MSHLRVHNKCISGAGPSFFRGTEFFAMEKRGPCSWAFSNPILNTSMTLLKFQMVSNQPLTDLFAYGRQSTWSGNVPVFNRFQCKLTTLEVTSEATHQHLHAQEGREYIKLTIVFLVHKLISWNKLFWHFIETIKVWKQDSTTAEEVARFQRLFPNPSWTMSTIVRKNIRSPKPCFNIPRDRQLP